jgi:hypothetical protein
LNRCPFESSTWNTYPQSYPQRGHAALFWPRFSLLSFAFRRRDKLSVKPLELQRYAKVCGHGTRHAVAIDPS